LSIPIFTFSLLGDCEDLEELFSDLELAADKLDDGGGIIGEELDPGPGRALEEGLGVC
jgi:hypothetical protein